MSRAALRHVRRVGRRSYSTVTLVPRKGQSTASIHADIARSDALAERLLERGVGEYHSHFRRVGPVKFMAYKEVGPPPWRWPRLFVQMHRRPLTFSMGCGWRSTAYTAITMIRMGP